ncbi:hypothetical protein B2J93_8959 [Marssonina coronariae]|uniref:Uncharacterized protein n=1 Tax=Diplocarpon coronariae TaxID=2795749 RepID=A0A218ZHI2_9HELO|nr:hypothetical protein B2J93_8959 [Marssonina coronariae]
MEYFRTLHVNGFDREPEPSDTNKVAAKYRKAYENMFSCSTTSESDTATTTPDIPAAERTRALAICTMVGAIRTKEDQKIDVLVDPESNQDHYQYIDSESVSRRKCRGKYCKAKLMQFQGEG